jgi:protein-S-isoprenylcysteine O-methyltransferase Ste14
MKKSLVTAIVSVIVFILLVINTIFDTNLEVPADILESVAVLIATGIMWFISHYYNQDYSAVAKKITPIMRKAKKLAKNGDNSLLDSIEILVKEWGGKDD